MRGVLGVAVLALAGCGGPMTAVEIYERSRPAIVMIETAPTQDAPAAEADSADCQDKPFGRGSGFVIDRSGFIVTNAHVAEPCPDSWPNPQLTVKTSDGQTLMGTLVGVDQIGDVAVIKVEHEFGTVLSFADSAKVKPGEDVVALGFPGFLDGEATITRGVVSVASRSWGDYGGVVQTDAAVNHGNSGGPLINSRGQVIGINTFIYRPQEDFEAINFAISARVASREVADIREFGEVRRADIGPLDVSVFDEMATVQSSVEANPYALGLLLTAIGDGSPLADKLRPCDMIDRINDQPVRSFGDYYNAMLWAKPGEEMRIDYLRYAEQKCHMPDPCAFKTGLSSWGTGCPLDPLTLSTRSPSVYGLLSETSPPQSPLGTFSISGFLEDQAKANKQKQIDEEATRILEAHRDQGEPQSVTVIAN